MSSSHSSGDNDERENDPSAEPLMRREGVTPRHAWDGTGLYAAALSVLVFLIVTWKTVLGSDPFKLGWFAFHPLLQSAGISIFTYGILTLQPTSTQSTKAAGLKRHQTAMFVMGLPIFLAGAAVMWYNKHIHGANHFTTWHGKLGLISIVWILLQVLIGAGSVWFNGAAFGGGSKAKAVYKYHRISGYILFALLMATSHLAGFWSDWVVGHSDFSTRWVAYTVAPAFAVVAIYARIRPSKMKIF